MLIWLRFRTLRMPTFTLDADNSHALQQRLNGYSRMNPDDEYSTRYNRSNSENMENAVPSRGWVGTTHKYAHRFRVLEFFACIVIFMFALVFDLIAVNERKIPSVKVPISANKTVYARDPAIDDEMMDEQVPMWLLMLLCISIPFAANITVNFILPMFTNIRIIEHDTRDFTLSFLLSCALSQAATHFMKNMTGRFRPSFYDMCGWQYDVEWDGETNLCTLPAEKEARKSFPSGHSSFAFCTLFFLTLYLLGRCRITCERRGEYTFSGMTKTLVLFICFAPSLLASWIAITRTMDNWHHYADILAGSILGAISASMAYSYNYGSIFDWQKSGLPFQVYHARRVLHRNDDDATVGTVSNFEPEMRHHAAPDSRSKSVGGDDHVIPIMGQSQSTSNYEYRQ